MHELEGARVLVVGGAGFVGSNLVRALLDLNVSQVVVVDNLLSSEAASVPLDERVELRVGSIAEDRVLHRLPDDLDVVFHLACYHGNQSSIHDPIADHQNNTLTSLKLFDHLSTRAAKIQKVVYAAAGCAVAEKTFDDPRPTTEDDPVSLNHDSPYSISKLVGEMYANYYHGQYGLPVVKTRFQNVYGPGEILGAGQWRGTVHTVWRNVVPTFIWRSLNGDALPLENGGRATRDFIFVGDLVDGLIRAAAAGVPGEVYNLASGIETSISELADSINHITGNATPHLMVPGRPWDHSGRRLGCTAKSSASLGFSATTPLLSGLEKTVEWTLRNRQLIQGCIDRHRTLLLT